MSSWLAELRNRILEPFFSGSRTLGDEAQTLNKLIVDTADGGPAEGMTLGQFSGCGDGNDRVNLSTLHSSKGREFRVVIMFGIDDGRIPRYRASQSELRESRRLFYVGFTRAKVELHLMYTTGQASPFVQEVKARLNEE